MKFLKYLLLFILVVTIIIILTIVSWWKDWPIFSGLVIVGGIFALILAIYGIKKLWQFKNKRQFISSIFNQQEKLNKENETTQSNNSSILVSEINATWKAGMQYFQKSNLRFNRRPELAQPWYLVLDDRHLNNAKNIAIFNSLGNNLKENSLLSWHFLNSAVLLHTGLLDENENDNNAWNELLTLISTKGKSALKGVIFSIDIQSLQETQATDNNSNVVDQNFAKLSKTMRERLNTLMLAINQNIPIYYICNGLEIIDGFNDWLNRLPTEILDKVYLGMLNKNDSIQQYSHEKSFKFFNKNNNNDNVSVNVINNHSLFTADNLIYQIQNFIREVIDKNALEGIPPSGDDLMLIVKLNAIIKNLFILFNSTFLENPHLITPNLRGAFFCASSGKDYLKNGKTAFLNAIINNVLNSEQALHLNKDLQTKFSLKATTKTICYLSFLGILFTFCGFVAIYTIYQNKVLNKLQTYQYSKYSDMYDQRILPNSFSNTNLPNTKVDETYDKLNKDLREILFLENASNNWWLPKFGVNILDRIIDIKREKFIMQAMDFVVNPILKLNDDFKYTENDIQQDSNITVAEIERIDKMVVLEWFTDKIYSIRSGELTLNNYLYHSNTEVFPINSSLEKIWNPLTDDIIIAVLYWGNQEDNLHNINIVSNIRKNLSLQFSKITNDSNKNKLTAMQPMLDLLGQRLNATDICLSNFWMHIVPKSQNDFCIPSIYTAKVANYLEETKGYMSAMINYNNNNNSNNDEEIDPNALMFRNFKRGYDKNKLQQESKDSLDAYYNNYVKSWYEFVLKFSDTLKDANDKEIFVRHTNFKNINDIPYLKLLRRMNEETIVLKNMDHPPSWLSGIGKLNILLDILTNLDSNIKDGDLSVLFNIAYTTPNSLKALRSATSSNEEMFQLIKSLPQLRVFFDDIRQLSNSLQNSEQALKIVTMFYSGTGITEENTPQNAGNDDSQQNNKNSTNNIASIYKNAGDFVANISSKYSDKNDPQLIIFRDMLNLLTTGLIIQAGNEIQHLWENEVLNSAVYRLHKDNADSMFGDNGIVQMFVAKHLKPFIVWRDGNPMSNVWENHTFPLTDNFLSMLRTGEQVVLNKPQDKYKISVYTQPTIVNVGAKALPNATKIVLECNDNQQEILNRNYPLARTFEYDTKLCSFVNISIIFPQFELQHKFESFGEFIAAFQEGEIILYADDFQSQSALLKEANINEIKVRILPDNTQNFVADQNMIAPSLPDKITYTW